MGKLKFFTVLFITVALTAVSCSKSKDDDPLGGGGNPLGNSDFTAKIDGKKFEAMFAHAYDNISGQTGKLVMITESAEDGAFTFGVDSFTGTGTYIMDEDNVFVTYINDDGTSFWLSEPGGKLVITSYTAGKRVKGTFEFTLTEVQGGVKEVTDGAFDVLIISN